MNKLLVRRLHKDLRECCTQHWPASGPVIDLHLRGVPGSRVKELRFASLFLLQQNRGVVPREASKEIMVHRNLRKRCLNGLPEFDKVGMLHFYISSFGPLSVFILPFLGLLIITIVLFDLEGFVEIVLQLFCKVNRVELLRAGRDFFYLISGQLGQMLEHLAIQNRLLWSLNIPKELVGLLHSIIEMYGVNLE